MGGERRPARGSLHLVRADLAADVRAAARALPLRSHRALRVARQRRRHALDGFGARHAAVGCAAVVARGDALEHDGRQRHRVRAAHRRQRLERAGRCARAARRRCRARRARRDRGLRAQDALVLQRDARSGGQGAHALGRRAPRASSSMALRCPSTTWWSRRWRRSRWSGRTTGRRRRSSPTAATPRSRPRTRSWPWTPARAPVPTGWRSTWARAPTACRTCSTTTPSIARRRGRAR